MYVDHWENWFWIDFEILGMTGLKVKFEVLENYLKFVSEKE